MNSGPYHPEVGGQICPKLNPSPLPGNWLGFSNQSPLASARFRVHIEFRQNGQKATKLPASERTGLGFLVFIRPTEGLSCTSQGLSDFLV